MRKIMGKLASVWIYLLVLCYLLKSEWIQLFDLKVAGLLLLGTGVLCLPHIDKKKNMKSWQEIVGRNAMMAGYLETFMLLFASMNSNELMREGLLKELGLDLRPILYGYILYIVLEKEGETKKEDENLDEDAVTEQKQESIWESEKLTRREKEVAALIEKNLSNREIAEELCISEATVKKHVSNIFEKLEIESRKELKRR